ncbi:MAG: ScyD/ScyE family protein [Saprospiraceae bacterium]|nr:ScyD/ScyE family protein [Saprospiraceae bacterium]
MKPVSILTNFFLHFSFERFPRPVFNVFLWRYLGVGLFLFLGLSLSAQTPELVASGFFSPVGLHIDADGNIWVAQSGSGNSDAAVSVITPSGESYQVISGLPSYFDAQTMEVSGVWRSRLNADGNLVLLTGFSETELANSLLQVDLSGYSIGDPAVSHENITDTLNISAFVLGQGFAESNPYDMLFSNDQVYIVDAAANAVLEIDADGNFSVLTVFPDFENPTPVGPPYINIVPTNIVANGDGFLVSCLTGFPFLEGAAQVFTVDSDGNNSNQLSDLTLLVDLDWDPNDGSLIILQLGSFDLMAGGFVEASGRVIRDDLQGNRDTIAQDLPLLSGMAVSSNGDIYVSDIFGGNVWRLPVGISGIHSPGKDPHLPIRLSPNPGADAIQIEFELAQTSTVQISILDQLGREMISLQDGTMAAGTQTLEWNGKSATDKALSPGLYFCRITVNGEVFTKTLIRQ